MQVKSATDVRREWSSTCEDAIRVRPNFIKRTRDMLVLSSADMFSALLDGYQYTATCFTEADGSTTISSNQMDLAENAPSLEEAKTALGAAILDYAEEYYNEYSLYSNAPNRKAHAPYVLKALLLSDPDKIGKEIKCQTHGS